MGCHHSKAAADQLMVQLISIEPTFLNTISETMAVVINPKTKVDDLKDVSKEFKTFFDFLKKFLNMLCHLQSREYFVVNSKIRILAPSLQEELELATATRSLVDSIFHNLKFITILISRIEKLLHTACDMQVTECHLNKISAWIDCVQKIQNKIPEELTQKKPCSAYRFCEDLRKIGLLTFIEDDNMSREVAP